MAVRDYIVPSLILGSHTTALGVIRSLARAGIRSLCITKPNRYITFSRHYRRPPFGYPFLSDPTRLDDYLAEFPLQRAVLFPCSDDWVLAVARMDDKLRERFPIVLSDLEILKRLIDKGNLRNLLDLQGIDHPLSFPVQSNDDLGRMGEQPDRVWILKPVDSQGFRTHFQRKAFTVGTTEEADRRFAESRQAGFEMILQEYIPGPASNHYFVDGYMDRAGILKSLFVRRRLRMHPPDFGDSSFMESIPKIQAQGAVDAITRLISAVGYRGIFSAEFKRDHRDDTFKLIEINTRAWAYIGFAAASGVNIALQAYRDALGEEFSAIDSYSIGKRTVFLINDIPAGIRQVRTDEKSLIQCLGEWIMSRKVTCTWDDPIPCLVNALENALPKLRRIFTGKK